jgi:hypothetical protein
LYWTIGNSVKDRASISRARSKGTNGAGTRKISKLFRFRGASDKASDQLSLVIVKARRTLDKVKIVPTPKARIPI